MFTMLALLRKIIAFIEWTAETIIAFFVAVITWIFDWVVLGVVLVFEWAQFQLQALGVFDYFDFALPDILLDAFRLISVFVPIGPISAMLIAAITVCIAITVIRWVLACIPTLNLG